MSDERNALTAGQMLANKTEGQLMAAIVRGRSMLAMDDILLPYDHGQDFDGPLPPSRNFQKWCETYRSERERLIKIGIADCVKELERRS